MERVKRQDATATGKSLTLPRVNWGVLSCAADIMVGALVCRPKVYVLQRHGRRATVFKMPQL
jgi:hypothetical protein